MFGHHRLHAMDHSLKPRRDFIIPHYTALTSMKTSNDAQDIFFIGTRKAGEDPATKLTYVAVKKFLAPAESNPVALYPEQTANLDSLKGFSRNPVSAAPTWVNAGTISPLSPLLSGKFVICIEGGFIMGDTGPSKQVKEFRLEGTGREEAISIVRFWRRRHNYTQGMGHRGDLHRCGTKVDNHETAIYKIGFKR